MNPVVHLHDRRAGGSGEFIKYVREETKMGERNHNVEEKLTVRRNYSWNAVSGNGATYLVSLVCDKVITALGSHCFSTNAI